MLDNRHFQLRLDTLLDRLGSGFTEENRRLVMVNFLPRSLFIGVEDFLDTVTVLGRSSAEQQAVICKEKMCDLWAISAN
jgi:hypothetical protein